MGVMIKPCVSVDQSGWLALRRALWPDPTDAEHLAEMALFLAQPHRFAQFIAYDEAHSAVGVVEASIRSDHVNGTGSTPVAFLEGIYVVPGCRRRGVARSLLGTVSRWAASKGIHEIASDVSLDNELSQKVHEALGFAETERVVFYRMVLPAEDG